MVAARWTDKVVELWDADGTITVLRSPDGREYAYCLAEVPIRRRPTGAFGSALLGAGIVTRQNQIVRYWTPGCGNDPSTVREYVTRACHGVRYSYAGRLPDGVTRVHFTGLGQQADATVGGGFWVHRIYTDTIANVNSHRVWITMYDATGRQVFRARY
jgi:hypothetical protein